MNNEGNVEFIQSVYAHFGSGDVQSVLDAMTNDVDWHLLGPEEMSLGGRRQGREEVARFFATIGAELDVEAFEPRRFMSSDDRVIVEGRERMRVRKTGRAYDVQWVHVFTIRDGKIASYREYTDTAAVLAANR